MLSRSGVYAIRAMAALAVEPTTTFRGVSELAKSTGSPPNYLGKLLLLLSRRGLVVSRKGFGGGFRLARRADQIRLLDVMAAIEDVDCWRDCAFAEGPCSDTTPCMVHGRMSIAREAFLSFLRDTNIKELTMTHATCPRDPGAPLF